MARCHALAEPRRTGTARLLRLVRVWGKVSRYFAAAVVCSTAVLGFPENNRAGERGREGDLTDGSPRPGRSCARVPAQCLQPRAAAAAAAPSAAPAAPALALCPLPFPPSLSPRCLYLLLPPATPERPVLLPLHRAAARLLNPVVFLSAPASSRTEPARSWSFVTGYT
ncbi:hypothetical protein VFPBJ_00345 [Purpureocillium lilacinum]|uniref:Uncharacterized protein n=1 Tax=Purpureocillium lilacinum TaxID=33203 RepID=A0A179H7W2_PURLI|nr:hypothetical protein VFPBJ_00345 [Purpureocillium lilacinum]